MDKEKMSNVTNKIEALKKLKKEVADLVIMKTTQEEGSKSLKKQKDIIYQSVTEYDIIVLKGKGFEISENTKKYLKKINEYFNLKLDGEVYYELDLNKIDEIIKYTNKIKDSEEYEEVKEIISQKINDFNRKYFKVKNKHNFLLYKGLKKLWENGFHIEFNSLTEEMKKYNIDGFEKELKYYDIPQENEIVKDIRKRYKSLEKQVKKIKDKEKKILEEDKKLFIKCVSNKLKNKRLIVSKEIEIFLKETYESITKVVENGIVCYLLEGKDLINKINNNECKELCKILKNVLIDNNTGYIKMLYESYKGEVYIKRRYLLYKINSLDNALNEFKEETQKVK